MKRLLHLLLIEDSEDDALLLLRVLRKSEIGVTHERVQRADDMRQALQEREWDIVIADYSMPNFNGLEAIAIHREMELDIPFILVSGTIGEDIAVQAMKAGAHDYVMKDNLTRLVPAIERELQETQERRARRLAEEKLRTLSLAVEQSPSIVIISDTDGMIEYVNPKYEEVTGFTAEEVTGARKGLHTFEIHSAEERAAIWQSVLEGNVWREEILRRSKNRDPLWISAMLTAIRDESGQANRVLHVLEDITERKQAETARRQSEARFRQLFEQAGDSICVIDQQGRIRDANPQACVNLGYTREELLQFTVADVGPYMVMEEPTTFWENALALTHQTVETWYRHKDSSEIPMEVRLTLFENNDEHFILSIARDITERRKFQEALHKYSEQLEMEVFRQTVQLRQSMEQISAILENSTDAIALAEPNGAITASNPAFKQLTGNDETMTIEQALLAITDPAHIETTTAAMSKALTQGEGDRIEVRLQQQDQTDIDADIAIIPVKDQGGSMSGVILSIRDITHLKDLDRLKTQFVANAAHDLANPIANLKLYTISLRNSPQRLKQYLPILEDQTLRLENLVNDLRTLSELDRGVVIMNREPVDIHDMLGHIVAIHEMQAASKGLGLHLRPLAGNPVIKVDRKQFERVVVNLLTNALNYTPEGGTIEISTNCENSTWIMSVTDSGIGMTEEDKVHIFERFYRSDRVKKTGIQGTGLGLAIVKEVVEAHHGQISVSSTLNGGSTFTVSLPQDPQ